MLICLKTNLGIAFEQLFSLPAIGRLTVILPLKLIQVLNLKTLQMKLFIVGLAAVLFACRTEREIQANMIDVSLIKIAIINRYPNLQQKMLTWRASDNVLYVTYEPMNINIDLGTKTTVLIRK